MPSIVNCFRNKEKTAKIYGIKRGGGKNRVGIIMGFVELLKGPHTHTMSQIFNKWNVYPW